jgi:L-asparagine oxygenase
MTQKYCRPLRGTGMTTSLPALEAAHRSLLTLRADEAAQLAATAQTSLPPSPYRDAEAFARAARLAVAETPLRLREALLDFEISGSPTGVLLLRGLRVGSLPATPAQTASLLTGSTLAVRTAAILTSSLGHLVGYGPESDGRLVQTVVPVRSDERAQKSSGSRIDLESHTEQCFNLRTRPAYVALVGLRGDPHALTYTLTARQVVAGLRGATVAALREPAFETTIDESFVAGGLRQQVRGPVPVLGGSEEDPTISYDQDLMRGTTPRHQAALAELAQLYSEARAGVCLGPGDLLLVDNARAVHGRSPFRPRYDGSDRWLGRMFCVSSLLPTHAAGCDRPRVVEASAC